MWDNEKGGRKERARIIGGRDVEQKERKVGGHREMNEMFVEKKKKEKKQRKNGGKR